MPNRKRARFPHIDVARKACQGLPDRNIETPDDILDLGLGNDQGRGETEVVLYRDPNDTLERGVVPNSLCHDWIRLLRVAILHDVEHPVEALAANVADAFVLRLQGRELRLCEFPEPFRALVQLVPQHDVELLERHSGGHWVARIGASPREPAISPRLLSYLGRRDGAANGEAGRKPLTEGNYVRCDAVMLHGPHSAGARGSELALIKDEERSPALCERREARQPFVRGHDHAARDRDGLDHNGCDVLTRHEFEHLLARLETSDVAAGVSEVDRAAIAIWRQKRIRLRREHEGTKTLSAIAADTGERLNREAAAM